MVSKEEEFLSCDIYSLPKYSSGATVSDFPHFSSSTPSQTPTGPLELVELALARHPNLPMHELRCLTAPPRGGGVGWAGGAGGGGGVRAWARPGCGGWPDTAGGTRVR